MKQLSRKKIQDMIDLNGANISSRRSSGGSGAGGGGGVSSAWVDEHYVSKDFFARLFTINGTTTEGGVTTDVVVEPNDLETTITNIQAMVGLWTEEYLSALGQGSGGGGGGGALLTEPLASINEAGMGTPSGENKVIAWNGNTWTYMPYTTGSGTVTSVTMTVPTGFKVSNGDTQTINNSGTFALTFGGTITKNQVLASPAAANGTPAWRALVADDIPSLAASKITSGTLDVARIPDLSSVYATTGRVTTLENNFDANGNAKSALRLTTVSKTAWGRTYWTANGVPDSIDGNMSSVGNISFAASGKNIGGIAYFDTTHGRLGIDKSIPTVTLDVGGYTKTTRLYLADDVYLVYDSANGGVHLVGAGLYADTYLSALGAGSGGGSGSGITMADVWSALATPAPSTSQEQIEASHLSQSLRGYATKSWVQGQSYVINIVGQGQSSPYPKSNGVVTIPVFDDTKNTAGATQNPNTKLYLIGSATFDTTYAQTYLNSSCYIGTDNCLYSNGSKVATGTIPTKVSQLTNDSGFITSYTDTKNTAGATQNPNTKLYLIGSATFDTTYAQTYINSSCYIGTDNCLYSNGSKVLTTADAVATQSWVTNQGYLSNGNISTLTFSNGASNRVFSINNNGANKLDVANVGISSGWETGYYVKSGNTYIGCLGLFGVGTSLDYAFIGTGYDNTWLAVKSNGNVGIGTNNTNPSYKLHVNGTGYVSSNFYTDGYLTISGVLQLYAASNNTYLTSNGRYFTITVGSAGHAVIDYDWVVTSDMRRKDVIMNAGASIEQIADAPIFYYRLKGSPETTLSLGSSAQYWQQVFPNAISENYDGFLSMNYSAIALASAVVTARKVQNHEERIADLERENRELREEIRLLKAS